MSVPTWKRSKSKVEFLNLLMELNINIGKITANEWHKKALTNHQHLEHINRGADTQSNAVLIIPRGTWSSYFIACGGDFMLEEIMKEFKSYRDAVYERVSEFMNYSDGKYDASAQRIGTSEDGLCELSEELDARLADIEDALCELSDDTTEIGAAGETGVK